MAKTVQIIDLFAGPGGLGEGFSSFKVNRKKPFKIAISIEKEAFEHQTLLLRSFYRYFESAPFEYYQYLRGEISREELFNTYPEQAKSAVNEAWQAELGSPDFPHDTVVGKIKGRIHPDRDCVLIGGPPCQAYSLVGRSKMGKRDGFDDDPRHTLYREYLNIISEFRPKIFVMENVKGILSSKLNGEDIFDRIVSDLKRPHEVVGSNTGCNDTYSLYSLVTGKETDASNRKDFTIKSEEYGIPQARHRVIILGIRNDVKRRPEPLQKADGLVSVEDAIGDLPCLRSGLSKQPDSFNSWMAALQDYTKDFTASPNLGRGGNYLNVPSNPKVYKEWYHDESLGGVLNHETRAHICADLHRYHYIASYAQKNFSSPKLEDLPTALLPNHKNVKKAISGKSLFNDRFRVQMRNKPATTVTSHISKDGHYFIHYDPSQCRSLTVREAARIQTFPDNYKFEGPRTSQYHQVGNAVPPLLAKQIASIVYKLMK